MTRRQLALPALLFCSGLNALIFQTGWMREFRLVFGASTPATASVLAIFMGGLGLGALLLGRRADAAARPLRLYAQLELVVSVAAALTPALVGLVRALYSLTGGVAALGQGGAAALRVLLSALVLVVPTVAMGGTLPAAARALTGGGDRRRVGLSLLYGANALGAVVGTLLSTFWLLEHLGTRGTLWAAAALNVAVAGLAWWLDRTTPEEAAEAAGAPAGEAPGAVVPTRFVLAAAAVTGFCFFLLELVWYRMLAPLLGGSVFTFGLILATALLGIALGSLASRSPGRAQRPSLQGFALACALCTIAVALPLGLGDGVALLALMLREWAAFGFGWQVAGWAVVTCVVVLPAALVSGLQFPLLVGLLGSAREGVGRDVGAAYGWNTAGAIAGSLLGGFGAIPLLGAVGAWRVCAALLGLLGVATLGWARASVSRARQLATAALLALGFALAFAPGPTAFWRHSPIGAGRGRAFSSLDPNRYEQLRRERQVTTFWEADGRESSLAMHSDNGIAFSVNGKSDGNALTDAQTQVMGGLIGALMHPNPRRVLVIGLGTGSTAGWLADLPGVERVDVVEIEPAVVEVARACAAVNRHVLENPRVHLVFTDAREVLMTKGETYDIVFSEPSNPYRAGVASLFTREFYAAVKARLAPGGVFLQWLQAYEVDAATITGVYATLAAEFPQVTTWTSQPGDLVLAGTVAPVRLEAAALKPRIATEPLASALLRVWRVDSVEGLNPHYVGDHRLAAVLAARGAEYINTDDRPLVEFAFARSVGAEVAGVSEQLIHLSLAQQARVGVVGADLARAAALGFREELRQRGGGAPPPQSPELQQRYQVLLPFFSGRADEAALARWQTSYEPVDAWEELVDGVLAAEGIQPDATARAEALSKRWPTEALVLRALDAFHHEQLEEATAWATRAFEALRTDPWAEELLVARLLRLAAQLGETAPARAERLLQATERPFAVFMREVGRRQLRLTLAERADFKRHCARALEAYEPWPFWTEELLQFRARCYEGTDRADPARADLERFRARVSPSLTRFVAEPK